MAANEGEQRPGDNVTSDGPANGAGDGNFNGPNLAGPPGVTGAVDGLQYGIVSDNDNTATGNSAITGTELTHHDVDFILTCSVTCTNGVISNVVFQYGTSNTEPSFGGGTGTGTATGQNLVPEPTSLLLFGSGLAATAYRARRKKNQKDSEPNV